MTNLVKFFEGSFVYSEEIVTVCLKFVNTCLKGEVPKTIKERILKGLNENKYIMVEFGNLYCYINKKYLIDIHYFLLDPSNDAQIEFIIKKIKFYDDFIGKKLIFNLNDDKSKVNVAGILGIHLFTYDTYSNKIVEKNDFFDTTYLDISEIKKIVQKTDKKIIWSFIHE